MSGSARKRGTSSVTGGRGGAAGGRGERGQAALARSLAMCGIPHEAYEDVIRALFIATGRGRAQRVAPGGPRGDRPKWPTVVTRTLGRAQLVVEDRGDVYAVWINRTDDDGLTQEMIQFEEFPWESPEQCHVAMDR